MEDCLDQLRALADPHKAVEMAAYHKVQRPYLGVANPVLNDLTRDWRREMTLDDRLRAAETLWDCNVHEARVAAGKLLTQARIRPDGAVWELITSWVPQFDAWAIADHACSAGARRLQADPSRLELVARWTCSDHLWTRRAALVMTLPWTKSNHPSPAEIQERDQILGWAAGYVSDPEWFIQKAIAWWLRELSKHDPDRVRAFLAEHGSRMKSFARREAGKYL